MGLPASEVFVTSFDTMYKMAYQEKGELRKTVRVKSNVIGSSHEFFISGKGVMTELVRGNPVVAVNADRSKRTATIADYQYAEFSYVADINKLSVDDKQDLVENAGLATGRKEDQIIINAINTRIAEGDFPTANALNIADDTNATPMTVAKLRSIRTLFNKAGVPKGERFAIVHPQQTGDLLGTTEVTSSDYNTVKTLVNGDVDTFLGFKFIEIGDRDEGGLTNYTISTEENYVALFYHSKAIGLAIGQDKMVKISYENLYTAYLINCTYSAGACVIDDNGLVAIQTGTATS